MLRSGRWVAITASLPSWLPPWLSSTTTAGSPSTSGGLERRTLIIGMTATNIPGLDTACSRARAARAVASSAVQLYDGLTRFDLTQGTHAPDIKPGLATSWTSRRMPRTGPST